MNASLEPAGQARRRRLATIALAALPGLVAAVASPASGATLAFAIGADVLVAVLLARAFQLGARPLEGTRASLDALAWLALVFALAGSTLLSSPFPHGLGSATPVRRAVLVLGALVAGAAAALVLSGASKDERFPSG